MCESTFFSILIATYNARLDLDACIESINRQIFQDYEILISDGGSTDGTLEYISSGIIEKLSWYKSAPDAGIYDALNAGLVNVSGKWLLVLGADDRLTDPEALSRAHRQITKMEVDVGIVYSDLFISYDKKVLIKKYPEFKHFERMYWGGPFIHHQSAFVSTALLPKIGCFSSDYQVHADYDLMLNALSISGAFKIDGAFVVFHSGGFSSKLRNLWRSFREVCNIRKSHGYFPMPPRLLVTYGALLVRRLLPFKQI